MTANKYANIWHSLKNISDFKLSTYVAESVKSQLQLGSRIKSGELQGREL